ncbi:MAG: FecR family protein [Candidatus Omnitrophota bacterium]
MNRVRYFAFGLSVGILFLSSNLIFAKELEREAKVIMVKADAKIQKAGRTEWLAAKEGMILSDGDTATTGKDSSLEVAFDKDNKNVIRLEENSTAILRGKMLKQIELPRGRIRSIIKELGKKSSFEIKTPTVVAGARGSGWDVIADADRDTVKAYEDEIFVQSFDEQGDLIKEIVIREGWEVFIERFQAPSELIELTNMDKQDWSSWKEDLGERIETKEPETTEGKAENKTPESKSAESIGKEMEDKTAAFENIESIEDRSEAENEYKEQISQIEDVKKIEERVESENVEEEETTTSSGGGCSGY